MFNIKKKTENKAPQVPADHFGHQAWQYQVTRELTTENNGPLYGLKKKVGDTYKVLLSNCSQIVPAVGNLVEYQVTHVLLENGLALIDSNGRIIFRRMSSVSYVSDELIVIEKTDDNGRYRLYSPRTRRLTSKTYTDFEVYDDYIQTFDGELTGILNWDFEEELEASYADAYPFGSVYKGITAEMREVLGSSSWEKPSAECERIFPESHGFFRAYNGLRYGFIRADTGRNLTKFTFESATDFERNGVAQVETGLKMWRYLDTNGKVLPTPGERVIL